MFTNLFDDVDDSVFGQLIASGNMGVTGCQASVQVTLQGDPVAVESAASVTGEPVSAETSTAQVFLESDANDN